MSRPTSRWNTFCLFICFISIANILNVIASMPYGCRLGLAKVNVLAYADDVVLLAPSIPHFKTW